MPCGIIKPDRIIQHVTEAVQALRVRRVGNEAIRLQKAVDIRRNPRSAMLLVYSEAHHNDDFMLFPHLGRIAYFS